MAKTAEKNLWNSMRVALKVFGADLHYTRIENSVSDGFPDVELQLLEDGVSYHATTELKTAARPGKPGTPVSVGIRPGQIQWLKKRWRVQGSAWILLQVGSGRELARYLIPGDLALDVSTGVPESTLLCYSVCKPNDPLDRITRIACTYRWKES
jgi:hypothetical protein